MYFGNWEITDKGILWNGEGSNRFVVEKNGLNRIRKDTGNAGSMYDWILLATDQEWLTQNDLYDFNYAFVYAAATFDLDFDYEIFDATLARQYEQFDAEDMDDLDLQ